MDKDRVLEPKYHYQSDNSSKKILIGRAINGISINELEYVLSENGKVKEFDTKELAILFLKDNGIVDKDVGYFTFEEIDGGQRNMPQIKPSKGGINKKPIKPGMMVWEDKR
jgi:hypothetical protein